MKHNRTTVSGCREGKRFLLVIASLLTIVTAHAGVQFIEEGDSPAIASTSAADVSPCAVKSGEKPIYRFKESAFEENGKLSGRGKAIKAGHLPVDLALKKLIPATYRSSITIPGAAGSRDVSWAASKTWVDAIRQAGGGIEELAISIDHESKEVVVRERAKLALATGDAGCKPLNNAATAIAVPPPVPNVWKLEAGRPIHQQLIDWGARAGWIVEWHVTKDGHAKKSWIVPSTAVFNGTFDQAISRVVDDLYNQGKPIYLKLWEGNHLAEILETLPQ